MNSRIRQVRKELQLTQEALATKMGIGKSALSMIETGKAALSERNKNIIINELNVNPEWLKTGAGEMFNSHMDIDTYRRHVTSGIPLQSVPLYNIETTSGLLPLFAEQKTVKPIDFIHIPNLPKCDGAIYVIGESMYPLLKSGDIVLYKQMKNIDDIFWGDMYLVSIDVDGEEYITVKYIQQSEREGYITLVSQNPTTIEKDVEISKINAIAFVKATIRIHSIR